MHVKSPDHLARLKAKNFTLLRGVRFQVENVSFAYKQRVMAGSII